MFITSLHGKAVFLRSFLGVLISRDALRLAGTSIKGTPSLGMGNTSTNLSVAINFLSHTRGAKTHIFTWSSFTLINWSPRSLSSSLRSKL